MATTANRSAEAVVRRIEIMADERGTVMGAPGSKQQGLPDGA